MGRKCEGCGVRMPFGVRRRKDDGGRYVCEGCRSGRPGRPLTQGARIATAGGPWVLRFSNTSGQSFYWSSELDDWVFEDSIATLRAEVERFDSKESARRALRSMDYIPVGAGPVKIPLLNRGARRTAAMISPELGTYDEVRVGDAVPGRLDWAEVERIEDGGPIIAGIGRMVVLHLDDGTRNTGPEYESIDIIRAIGSRHTAAEEDPFADDSSAPDEESDAPVGGAAPPPPPAAATPPGLQPEDRQSDAVVRVCPFCGSGSIVGNADGSIECGYDGIVFTIEVQPRYLGQPLVNPDGSPFEPDFGTDDDYPAIGMANAEEQADPLADSTVPNPGEDPRGLPDDPAGLNAMQGGVPEPGQDPRTAIRRR